MEEMGALLGLSFTDVQERPDGERTLRVAFSTGAPRIELIEGNPDGTWTTESGPRIDHLAFWIEDFGRAASAAEAAGMRREAGGRAAWGGQWAYVRGLATGARIELCDAEAKPYFAKTWKLET